MLPLVRQVANSPMNRGARGAAIARLVRWQVAARLGRAVVYPFVNDTRVLVRRGMTGMTQNLYCGLSEPPEMGFTLHLLRPGDLFVDVGANVGSYTLLASGVVGAETIAFEPSPSTYKALLENVRLNGLDRVEALNAAAGHDAGELEFTEGQDTVNHVVAQGEEADRTVRVPVHCLDRVLEGRSPTLIKIDTEGFEKPVVQGAKALFESRAIQAAIIEMNGSGDRYGFDEVELDQELRGWGYRAYTYEPFSRELAEAPPEQGTGNRIYLCDEDWARGRIQSAPKFRIRNTGTLL